MTLAQHTAPSEACRHRAIVLLALISALGAGTALVTLGLAEVQLTPLAQTSLGALIVASIWLGVFGFARATRFSALHQERLKTLLEGTDVVVWEFDPELDAFLYVSPQIERYGHPVSDWYEKGIFAKLIHQDDRERVLSHCGASTLAGLDHVMTYRMIQGDGSYVWIHDVVRVSPRPGQAPLLRGVFVDVTQMKEVEFENERLRVAAEASDQSKSEFLANMSHEIRTPLTAVLGYTQLMLHDGSILKDTERTTGHLRTIDAAGQHLLTLINDVLDLSKIEADKMAIEEVEMSLKSLLTEALDIVRQRLDSKPVELRCEIQSELPEVIYSDPTRLRQILINLVGNAIKFTDEGHVLLIAARTPCGQLRLEVEDSGRGMTPEESIELFQPFVQVDGSVTRRYGGTGLGLTISRRLAGLMGGTVGLVRTEPNVGSSFAIQIPLHIREGTATFSSLAEAPKVISTTEMEPAESWAARVLLVEDGLVNQRLISTILKKAGAEVVVANHGLEALEQLAATTSAGEFFDLIVTDMQMPEMDGYALATELRERGETLPILALTAHAMAEDRKKCLDAGCSDFATKPIERKAFLEACRRLTRASEVDEGESQAA